jgi:hypothetical protein
MADAEDHETAEDDGDEVTFTPSFHLEWLLGDDVDVVFEADL